ncbi:MAG: hypothetical protein CMH30_08505 [Micavibrio sp.]|nr:hypothetical protein [Micavibrio sp.]
MIIVCPECSARYLIQTSSVGPSGKKVKCASCKHVWHQEPETEEILIDVQDDPVLDTDEIEENDTDPALISDEEDKEAISVGEDVSIPHSVRPNVDHGTHVDDSTAGVLPAYSVLAAIFIGLLLVVALGQFPAVFTKIIPGMEIIYEKAGIDVTHDEESLMLDRIYIRADEKNAGHYIIEGVILNLAPKSVEVPFVKVQPLDRNGVILGEPIYYQPEQNPIPAESAHDFTLDYQTEERVADFELRFVFEKDQIEKE